MCFFSIYNKFKLRKWQKFSPGKRQQILEQVEQKQAKKLNRPVLPVIVNDNPRWNSYGMFEAKGGREHLVLSINLLTQENLRFHALETILHEGRHAYQYHLTNSTPKGLINKLHAKKWKENYGGYITSAEDQFAYSIQPIERDAQKYAIKQMKKMKFRFGREEDYQITIESMEYRYNETVRKMKERHGIFYRHKINKRIKEKNRYN
ncbi:MAG: hypothetical protein ACI4T8_03725 [Christensenellales bacterium]